MDAATAANAHIAATVAHIVGSAFLAASTTGPEAGEEGAATCRTDAANVGVPVSAIRQDFECILHHSRRGKWTDDTPVPPSVFGPLDEPSALVLELRAPTGTDPKVVGASLVKLWEVTNEYHMTHGGGVLTFDEFKQMMPALVPVGPHEEG